jgi:hypothetical protein
MISKAILNWFIFKEGIVEIMAGEQYPAQGNSGIIAYKRPHCFPHS